MLRDALIYLLGGVMLLAALVVGFVDKFPASVSITLAYIGFFTFYHFWHYLRSIFATG